MSTFLALPRRAISHGPPTFGLSHPAMPDQADIWSASMLESRRYRACHDFKFTLICKGADEYNYGQPLEIICLGVPPIWRRLRETLKPAKTRTAESYKHPESESPMRPDVGTQAQFKKKKPPVTYRYDSSLSPALDWDGQNSAREVGERHLSVVQEELSVARRQLSVEKPDLKAATASLTQGRRGRTKPQGHRASRS